MPSPPEVGLVLEGGEPPRGVNLGGFCLGADALVDAALDFSSPKPVTQKTESNCHSVNTALTRPVL
jgi:hypothetical protein